MKLRNLNGLIRKNDGAVKMRFQTAEGELIVGLVKGELLSGLQDLYGDTHAEVSLNLVDGFLVHENDGVKLAAAKRLVAALEGGDLTARVAVAETTLDDLDLDLSVEPELDLLSDDEDLDDLDLLA